MADATAALRETSPGVYELDLNLPRGEKGDPGGITLGTDLGTQNLNTIVTPGMYRQPDTAKVTPLNNYPSTTMSGPGVAMMVTSVNSAIIFQRLEFVGGASLRTVYERATGDGGASWTAWRTFASSRVDETAGRAIYTWDDKNNREQLIYGDTGARTLSVGTMVTSDGSATFARVRRVGQLVSLNLRLNLVTTNSTGANILAEALLPGFRPGGNAFTQGTLLESGGTAYSLAGQVSTGGELRVWWTTQTTGVLSGVFTYPTNDAWPTTLPGSAQGGIPNT